MKKIQALYEFVSKLSKREKTILYCSAFFITLALTDRLLIGPITQKLSLLDQKIDDEEMLIKRSMRILSQKERILTESDQYSAFFGSLKSEEEEISSILKEIENQASKTSIYLIDVKPSGVKNLGSSKKYMVSLSCEGQMDQVMNFFYNIESSDKLLLIDKYQITPKSLDSSIARCTMTISKVAIN